MRSTSVDNLIAAGAITIPARPGPDPACSDAELLTVAMVRHLLGRRSEAGFPAEVARDWPARGAPVTVTFSGGQASRNRACPPRHR